MIHLNFLEQLYGAKILSSDKLFSLKNKIEYVLIATLSLSFSERKKIINKIQKAGISALTIPSIKEITQKVKTIDTLKPIPIQDLLGRDVVTFNKKTLEPLIKNSEVCVTGGGGSIGRNYVDN